MTDETMNGKPCCGNCNAWTQTQGDQGNCLANPPTPVLLGVADPNQGIAGLAIQKLPPQPVVQSFFPPIKAFGWCRAWQARGGGGRE